MNDMVLPSRLSLEDYADGILARNRVILGKAITLIESTRPDDQDLAQKLITTLLPHTGKAFRLGVTGIPGVGKSTFIEAFGQQILQHGHSLAVLAIDPTSMVSGGSILGDKTRMENLSKSPDVFIRPSPAGAHLGGIAAKTREAMLLCEAAGFTWILVETVGVGQSETSVRNMVDFFLLLMLAGAGDELQGIKKGIIELADALVFTKADGPLLPQVQQNMQEFRQALHLVGARHQGWEPPVVSCSAINNTGLDEIYQLLLQFELQTKTSGFWQKQRELQSVEWMEAAYREKLYLLAEGNPDFKRIKSELIVNTANQQLSPGLAADLLIKEYINLIKYGSV